jgi:hypothetical protein
MTTERLFKLIPRLSVAGIVLYLVIVLALHGLSPEFSPITQFISEYGRGTYGWLASIAFFAQGLSAILLGISFWRTLSRPGLSIVGLVLLLISGVLFFLFAFFPVDPDPQAPTTLAGAIHFWAGMAFFVLGGLFPLLLALRFKNDERIKSIYTPALGLGIAAFVVDALGFVLSGAGLSLEGLTQRVFFSLVSAWMLLTALRLAASSTEPDSA